MNMKYLTFWDKNWDDREGNSFNTQEKKMLYEPKYFKGEYPTMTNSQQ